MGVKRRGERYRLGVNLGVLGSSFRKTIKSSSDEEEESASLRSIVPLVDTKTTCRASCEHEATGSLRSCM